MGSGRVERAAGERLRARAAKPEAPRSRAQSTARGAPVGTLEMEQLPRQRGSSSKPPRGPASPLLAHLGTESPGTLTGHRGSISHSTRAPAPVDNPMWGLSPRGLSTGAEAEQGWAAGDNRWWPGLVAAVARGGLCGDGLWRGRGRSWPTGSRQALTPGRSPERPLCDLCLCLGTCSPRGSVQSPLSGLRGWNDGQGTAPGWARLHHQSRRQVPGTALGAAGQLPLPSRNTRVPSSSPGSLLPQL